MGAVLQTFAGGVLDRVSERRSDESWVAERLSDPASRAVVAGRDGVLVEGDRVARVPLREAAEPVLLGVEDGAALFAVEARDGDSLMGLREAAATLAQDEGGLAAYAAALRNWHRTHRHCARCGARTEPSDAGHVRACPSCSAHHHPRTDPVVIMLVEDGDRLLLGRQAAWPAGVYSALAGFVEHGESLEEAVAREVSEEAGVTVQDVRYVASQPWPFPTTLMLGFVARWAAGEPHARDDELEEVRWFSRAELEDAVAGRGPVALPPPLAIARRLIEGWLDTVGAR
jgi:NAD+ diphosphatase